MSSIGSKVKSFFQNMVRPPPANVVAAAASAASATMETAFARIKPHVPLIKFRKGSGGHHEAAGSVAVPSFSAPASTASSPVKSTPAPGAVLEDWQLPQRLRRRPIPPEEIEYINRGGPQ